MFFHILTIVFDGFKKFKTDSLRWSEASSADNLPISNQIVPLSAPAAAAAAPPIESMSKMGTDGRTDRRKAEF